MADQITLPALPTTIGDLVAVFIKTRDALKAADDAHKQKTSVARAYREALEVELLRQLNNVGGQSVATPAGTVYRTTRRSATIADGAAFRSYVIENTLFDLVDMRANAPAINDFVQNNNGQLPPGVNYTETYTVGVQRA